MRAAAESVVVPESGSVTVTGFESVPESVAEQVAQAESTTPIATASLIASRALRLGVALV